MSLELRMSITKIATMSQHTQPGITGGLNRTDLQMQDASCET